MAEHGNQRKIGGSAGTLVSLASAVYLQQNPAWGTLHPHVVLALYVVAGLSLLYTLLQWPIVQRIVGIEHSSTNAEQATAPSAKAEVNAPATATSTGNTINWYAPPPTVPQPAPVPPPPEEKVLPAFPALKFRIGFASLGYNPVPGMWVERSPSAHDAKEFILAYFENPVPRKDELGRDLGILTANIQYQHPIKSERVTRAYWLRRPYNGITLDSGHEEAVLVGCFNTPFFSAYRNNNGWEPKGLIFTIDMAPDYIQVGERVDMAPVNSIKAEISVVLTSDGEIRTIESKIICIDFSSGKPSVYEVTS